MRLFHAADTGYVLVEVDDHGISMVWKQREGPNKYSDGGDRYDFPTGVQDEFNVLCNFILYQSYPNPFNPYTVIRWQLAVGSHVELTVYNLLGEKVKTLVSSYMNAGIHTYRFNGNSLAGGVYYYQLVAGKNKEVKKMILLR